jgi:PadR family transcriptional regulator, regulatory protein PadR
MDSLDEFFENWTVQVRKGLLELCVLNALAEKEYYGYELVKTMVSIPGLGVTEGTLYPLLSRLRLQGLVRTKLVESAEGPDRKYYSLSTEGKKIVRLMNAYIATLSESARVLQNRKGEKHEDVDVSSESRTGEVSRRHSEASGAGRSRRGGGD